MTRILTILIFLYLSQNLQAQEKEWYPYKNEDGKWSFVSVDGEQLNDIAYDSIIPFFRKTAQVMLDKKWGFIDKSGEYIIPAEYDTIRFSGGNVYSRGYLIVGKKVKKGNYRFGVFGIDGSIILQAKFRDIKILSSSRHNNVFKSCIAAQLMDTVENGSIGLYNPKGEQLLAHEYSSIKEIPYDDRYIQNPNFHVYVTQRQGDQSSLVGAYNTSLKKWIFPCKYKSKLFYDGYTYYDVFRNRTAFRPVTDELYAIVPSGYRNSRYSYDYYTESGEFLFNSSIFDQDPHSTINYYVTKDSIIGKTTHAYVKKLCDSLDRYFLLFGQSLALYDLDKGFLVDSGLYHNYPAVFLDKGYFTLKKFGSWSHDNFDFEGNIYVIPDDPKVKYKNGQWIVRDSNGKKIDMSPYTVKGKSFDHPKFGECFYAQKDDHFGVVTASKKIVLPFKYDYYSRNYDYGFIRLADGKKIILLDSSYKKITQFNNVKWEELMNNEYERFILLKSSKSFSIYDLKTKKIILKNRVLPSKEVLDTMEYFGFEDNSFAFAHWTSDSNVVLQLFDTDKGWAYYDDQGDLIFQSPTKSYFPMRPIVVPGSGQFIGMINTLHTKASNGSYDLDNKYTLFNGVILESLDSVGSIQYNPLLKQYFAYDLNNFQYLYEEDGTLIYKYLEITGNDNGYFIVRKPNGFNICDSVYQELLPEEFSNIWRSGDFFTAYRGSKMFII